MGYTLKTQKNTQSVQAFLDAIQPPQKQEDCKVICALMKEIAQQDPCMWGDSIVGFGAYTYNYASGHSGEWFKMGFSPRKQNITIYSMPGYHDFGDLLDKLGRHKLGKCCLYINKLSQIDLTILKALLQTGYEYFNT